RRFLRRRGALRGAERELHARGRRAVAVVTLVARTPAILADPDLRAALVGDDGRRHRAVAEEHVGLEALAGLRPQTIDDERLAVADAVLLVAESDDRVIGCHSVENAGVRPASRGILATRAPTRSSACNPTRPSCRSPPRAP